MKDHQNEPIGGGRASRASMHPESCLDVLSCALPSPVASSSSSQTKAHPRYQPGLFLCLHAVGRIMPPTHSIMSTHSPTPRPSDAEHPTGFTILRCSARHEHVGWQPLQQEHCHVLWIVVRISWGHTRRRWSDAHRAGGALHSALASIPVKLPLHRSILPPTLHCISHLIQIATALFLSHRVFFHAESLCTMTKSMCPSS